MYGLKPPSAMPGCMGTSGPIMPVEAARMNILAGNPSGTPSAPTSTRALVSSVNARSRSNSVHWRDGGGAAVGSQAASAAIASSAPGLMSDAS